MGKKSFIIYQNWARLIQNLDDEKAGILIKAVCAYFNGEDVTIEDDVINAIYTMIVEKIAEDAEKYEKVSKKRREAIEKRWKGTKEYKSIQMNTNVSSSIQKNYDTDTDTDTDTDNNNINNRGINAPPVRKFIPPTIEEVRAYCKERQNKVDPDAFINFYESKGWMIGKNKMKDWKAAVRTWEKNEKIQPITQKKPAAGFHNFEERKIDCNDLMKRFVRN